MDGLKTCLNGVLALFDNDYDLTKSDYSVWKAEV